jgi:hypothetical protein
MFRRRRGASTRSRIRVATWRGVVDPEADLADGELSLAGGYNDRRAQLRLDVHPARHRDPQVGSGGGLQGLQGLQRGGEGYLLRRHRRDRTPRQPNVDEGALAHTQPGLGYQVRVGAQPGQRAEHPDQRPQAQHDRESCGLGEGPGPRSRSSGRLASSSTSTSTPASPVRRRPATVRAGMPASACRCCAATAPPGSRWRRRRSDTGGRTTEEPRARPSGR